MIDPEIDAYYAQGAELGRLDDPRRAVEYLRTLDLLERHLPRPPAGVLDVGSGPGRYALALARAGYRVTALDPVALHREQARAAAAAAGAEFDVVDGDARDLAGFEEESFAAVLLLGPLYHLLDPAERDRAWGQAARVLVPGGIAAAVGVSRFYSPWEMFSKGKFDLPGAGGLMEQHLSTGVHRNPGTTDTSLWTTAYLHAPAELAEEAGRAGLEVRALVAVEGPAKLLPDLGERIAAPAGRERLMEICARLEAEPSTLGMSEHVMVIARKPGGGSEAEP